MTLRTAIAAVLCVLSSGFAASAQSVTVVGCPVFGVEPNCMVIRGPDNVTYNITDANPRPNIGQRAVRLTGTKVRRAHKCQQGTVLANITWSYVDQKCSQ